jgi:hypothetical protein
VLVPPDDSRALADTLMALSTNPREVERLGSLGFAGVREHYSIARSTDRLLEVYASMGGSEMKGTRVTRHQSQ